MRFLLFTAGLLLPPFFMTTAAAEWQINTAPLDLRQTPQLTLSAAGDAYVAYRDHSGQLFVRRPDQAPLALTAPGQPANGLALEAFGERVYAAWLGSTPGGVPAVVLRARQDDGTWLETQVLDSASRPLPRIRLAGTAEGEVTVLWLGDAPDADAETPPADTATPNYHLYARRSTDGGRTWLPTRRLSAGYDDAFWPALTVSAGHVHLFADARRAGNTYLIHAQDSATGWSAAETIKPIGSVLLIDATTVNARPLTVWFGAYGDRYRLESAVRDGDTWKTYVFPDSANYDIGSMDLTAADGNAYLVFSARSAYQSSGPRKNMVYFSRSTDGGNTWEPIQPLRHYPFALTQANFPHIATGKNGTVVAAWNDYRNIRGDLYYNRSTDGGATWLEQDLPLDTPGVAEDVLFPFVSNLRATDNTFSLLAARQRDDGLAVADLYLHTLPATPAVAPPPDPAATQERLEQRVTAFWQALLNADSAAAYALFDPYFRLRMRESEYVAQSGRVKHHRFQLKDVTLQGNIAQVTVEFVYEIPQMTLPLGGTYARPETPAAVRETWLFIDGQWYKEYHNEIGDFAFTRY